MTATVTFLGVLFTLTIFQFADVEGLKCYNCVYFKSGRNERGDPTCKEGVPNLALECNEHTPIPSFSESGEGHYLSDFGKKGQSKSQKTFGCATIKAKAEIHGQSASFIMRTCTMNIVLKSPTCKNQTLKEWNSASETDPFSSFVDDLVPTDFEENDKLEGCYCDTDECNLKSHNAQHRSANSSAISISLSAFLVSITTILSIVLRFM